MTTMTGFCFLFVALRINYALDCGKLLSLNDVLAHLALARSRGN